MQSLIVIAAFAVAAVAPFMSGATHSDQPELSDDSAAQPDAAEPDGDKD